MLIKCYNGLICVAAALFNLYSCQQQIKTQDVEPELGKKFVVYFVEPQSSKLGYDSWLCGGALVSPTQILTAAACLVETEKIYAIAGYKKYVDPKDIENDECTKARKQRVVKILVPTEYKSSNDKPAKSINVDVGVAIVEKPYNFSDLTYRVHCSYEPQPIFVNFENKYELASTRAVAFGWGNTNAQTQPGDLKSQLLQEASTVIVDKKVCSSTVNAQEVAHIIEKYLLCASNSINDERKDIKFKTEEAKDCRIRRYDLTKATDTDGCLEDDFGFRKNNDKNKNGTEIDAVIEEKSIIKETEIKNETNAENYLYLNSRRYSSFLGPCQNGYGCPLIKWVGDKQIVIGIASNANKDNECNGPYLYVSTAATSKIIKCLLETNAITRKFCNQEIHDKRYEVEEIDIKWPDYPQKRIIPVIPIIKRAIPDDQPLVPRPTKDIYIVSRANEKNNPKGYNQPGLNPDYKQTRSVPQDPNLPAQPFNRNQPQKYQQPQDNRPIDPKAMQAPQYGPPQERPMDPSYNQHYEPPTGQQYGPPMDQQYEVPQGQYEPSPDHEYEFSPGQYYPQLRQPYDPQQGQQYEMPPDQRYEQPPQEYEPPPQGPVPQGAGYGQPEQQYDPQTGQPYEPAIGQHYDPQTGQQYEMQQGQQYESPQGQQYEAAPNMQYEAPQMQQQYESAPPQQNEQTAGQEYEQSSRLRYDQPSDQQGEAMQDQSTEPPMGQQYDQQTNQQYQPKLGQYDTSMSQQYKEQESQHYQQPNQQPNQQSSQQQGAQQYESQQEQQYYQSQGQSQGQPQQRDQSRDQHQGQGQERQQMQQLPESQGQSQMQSSTPDSPMEIPQLFDQRLNQPSTEKTESQTDKPSDSSSSSQSFDLIFSDLHNLPKESSQSNSPVREETFEQLYSHLHEPSFDLPHELTVPQYSGPPDEQDDESEQHHAAEPNSRQSDSPGSEQPNLATPRSDDVRVRPQMPIDYQNDYFFYSHRRNGSDS